MSAVRVDVELYIIVDYCHTLNTHLKATRAANYLVSHYKSNVFILWLVLNSSQVDYISCVDNARSNRKDDTVLPLAYKSVPF